MPKGSDLSDASQTWLNDVAALMNNRPGKTPGWRAPAEAMADKIAAFKSTVALDVEILDVQSQTCKVLFAGGSIRRL
jgi:hypothetical protein